MPPAWTYENRTTDAHHGCSASATEQMCGGLVAPAQHLAFHPSSREDAICACMLPVEPQAGQLDCGREKEHAQPQAAGDLQQIGGQRDADDSWKRSRRVGDAQ
mmetsp:Transcript_6186/g.38477  ORF Transcript_6186/g.38477 Transcript_6186/m.38477 type:complete len:103 (+) Transcript_6186:3466-3774(+)